MGDRSIQHRLAAALGDDFVADTRLMAGDSDATMAAWASAHEEVVRPTLGVCFQNIAKLNRDAFPVDGDNGPKLFRRDNTESAS